MPASLLPPGAREAPDGGVLEDADAFLGRLEGLSRSGARVVSAADAAALDALAVWSARGHGAYEVGIGEGLDLLHRRRGDIRLGYSGVGDLARERLGLPADQARRMRRNAEKLRARPRLRAAVVSGEVTSRKAEIVLDRAMGGEEDYWTDRARVETARALETAVREDTPPEELDFHRIRLGLPADGAEVVERAIEIAGIVLGPTTPRHRRVEVVMMEFLAEFPVPPREQPWWKHAPDAGAARRPLPPLVSASSLAEAEAAAPGAADAARAPADAACAPADVACGAELPASEVLADGASFDPYEVLARLERLVRERAGLDEHLGRSCSLVRHFRTWRRLGYVSFDHWCAEHLGIPPRTVRQRVALERRLQALPPLREALRSRKLSCEQARQVARLATPADVEARITEAASTTCIALRRALDREEERQMWSANELRVTAPEDVCTLVSDALRAARLHLGPGLTPGDALVRIAAHFVVTWAPEAIRLLEAADEVVLRDGGLCGIPACSRAAGHVHHVVFRSAGGPLEDWNELSSCIPHHLLGIHQGNVLVTGRAPDELTFALGEREVRRAKA